jgi:hypothetical protein
LDPPSWPAITAEAMLCRQYLGWPRNDKRLVAACDWITKTENLVNFRQRRDVYYWYYATQVCHHMGGEHWQKWNEVMRQRVPEAQLTSGRESGSWDPDRPTADKWGTLAGRLYTTCLSIYILEVYYRHLPLYANVYSLAAETAPAATVPSKPAEPKPEAKPPAKSTPNATGPRRPMNDTSPKRQRG